MNLEPQNLPDDDQQPELFGLLFESSPYGNLDAIVQHDGRVAYFYLNGDESFGTRACWVRNLVPSPLVLNQQDVESGVPPLLPKTHCSNPSAQPIPDAKSLEIVWFEEGNGAALFENGKPLAIIPPWSGVDGFHGYASECVLESPIAWPMVDNEQLNIRIDRARQFWKSCSLEQNHPFAQIQANQLQTYQQHFSLEGQYYSLDGGNFPPRGAIVFQGDDYTTILSVGMAMRPQPNVEMSVEQPASLRRIELGLSIKSQPNQIDRILEQFSGLVAYPWKDFTWFGHGHTCKFPSLLESSGTDEIRFESESVSGKTGIELPPFREDQVQILWMEPVV